MSLFLVSIATGKPASGGGGASDSDAQAFLTAAGISDGTITSAIDNLVIALKAASLWTKCIAIYPFVGGTASTHKWNLKNPANTDGAFRITFSGTITHNANGVTGNGSSGYGDTHINPSSALTLNDVHMSVYSRSSGNTGENQTEIGAISTNGMGLNTRRSDLFRFFCHKTSSDVASTTDVANTDATGFYLGSRRSASDQETYKNGVSQGTTTGTQTGSLVNASLYIMANNVVGPTTYSNKNLAFVSVGSGLSDSDAAAFNTCVSDFQTALSRNV